MKSIIEWKIYDTEKSTEIGWYYSWNLQMWQTLYKSPKWQYYLVYYFQNWSPEIKLVSESEIMIWIEENEDWFDEETYDNLLKVVSFKEG
jgi:hypothetical protein